MRSGRRKLERRCPVPQVASTPCGQIDWKSSLEETNVEKEQSLTEVKENTIATDDTSILRRTSQS